MIAFPSLPADEGCGLLSKPTHPLATGSEEFFLLRDVTSGTPLSSISPAFLSLLDWCHQSIHYCEFSIFKINIKIKFRNLSTLHALQAYCLISLLLLQQITLSNVPILLLTNFASSILSVFKRNNAMTQTI